MYSFCTLLALVCCSCNKLTEGKIIDKFYEEEEWTTSVEYDITLEMPMVVDQYDDEDFVFYVTGVIDSDTITERIEVSLDDYNSYKIGDYIKLK
jgi:hypothetical protein